MTTPIQIVNYKDAPDTPGAILVTYRHEDQEQQIIIDAPEEQPDLFDLPDRVMRALYGRATDRYIDPSIWRTSEHMAEILGVSVWTVRRYGVQGLLARGAAAGRGYKYRVHTWINVNHIRGGQPREALERSARAKRGEAPEDDSTKSTPVAGLELELIQTFDQWSHAITPAQSRRIMSARLDASDDEVLALVSSRLADFESRTKRYKTAQIVTWIAKDFREDLARHRARQQQTAKDHDNLWPCVSALFTVVRTGEHLIESQTLYKRVEYTDETLCIYKVRSKPWMSAVGRTYTAIDVVVPDSVRAAGGAQLERAIADAYLCATTLDRVRRSKHWPLWSEGERADAKRFVRKLVQMWIQ